MLGYDYSKIDFNKPVDRSVIDMKIYNRKFELADKAFNNPNTHPKVLQALLKDKTIRIYFKFKINNKRVKLYPFQDLIINDPHRFKYFRAANQIGKSEYIDCDCGDDLTLDHGFGHNAAVCSISLKQATFQMLRIKDRLRSASLFDWQEEKGDIDNMGMLSFNVRDNKEKGEDGQFKIKYVNRLIITPAGEGILGFDLHKIYPDEFEFWKDIDLNWFVNQLAEPRTFATYADTGIGNLCFTTNPNGANNYGAELETLHLPSGEMKYHTYVFNHLDRPGNTEKSLEIAKVGKTRAQIESTLLAIRSLSSKNYFTDDEIDRSEWKEENPLVRMVGKQPFFFLDVGAKHDQSALIGGYIEFPMGEEEMPHVYIPIMHVYPVGYPITRAVGSYSKKHRTDGWHYEKSVKEYLKEWRVDGIEPTFGVDVTGNSGISPLFESVDIFPEDVTMSGPCKSGMYQQFKVAMENYLIHRIKNKDWEYQAKHMQMKKSKRKYLLIHHENESDLDDTMDATAGLMFLMDPFGGSDAPVSANKIEAEQPNKKVKQEDNSFNQEIADIEEARRLNASRY